MKNSTGALALSFLFGSAFVSPQIWSSLLSTNYLPHRYCYLIQPWLVWTNVVTDGLIALAYATIFASLLWVASKLGKMADYRRYLWILVAFASFILACAATHVMEVVTVWVPVYPLSAAFKVLCALISVPTAIAFAWGVSRLAVELKNMIVLRQGLEQERDWARRELEEEERLLAEREKSAQALAKANARLQAVMDSTSDGIMKVQYDWTISFGNRVAFEQLPDFAPGKQLWECFPALLETVAEEHLRRAMAQRVKVEYENYYAPYDQWFKTYASPMEGGLSIFYSDITQEKKLQEALDKERWLREKRIQALSHMAGGLAHEISNPLAIIHGYAADLKEAVEKRQVIDIGEIESAAGNILRMSDRAIRILRGLRGFGRDAAKDEMEMASVYEIVEGCAELQQTRLERHDVTLRLHLPDGLPYVLCRDVQIGQIVTNLLNNAFDAIVGAGSTERWIELRVARREQDMVIDVIDSGPGISEETREHLMEAFYTTKEASAGMGVGLSLSRAMAEDHGGSLTLLSGSRHTCFRLTIPTPDPEEKT